MKKMLKPQVTKKRFCIGRVLKRWQLYLLALPAVLYTLVFNYKPMYGIIIAFKHYKPKLGILGSPWVGFDNFERLFNSYWFPIIMRNTLTLSSLSLIIGFPMPIILALLVNEVRSARIKKTFQIVSYAPHFISTVVVCSMVILFTSPSNGIINHMIKALGGEPYAFMQKEKMFKWVYTLSGTWQGMGWGAILYYATLSSVDKNLHEAAQIDGANLVKRIWYINIPVLIPTVVISLIMSCGRVLSVGYEKVYLLQNSTNLAASEVISTYVYKVGLEQSDFAFSTATGLFNSVINIILVVTVNKIAKKISGSGLW